MGNLFWGFVFILLDFNITVNNSVIGLIPDFIGFILIFRGLNELRNFSTKFTKIQPFVSLMIFLKMIAYVMDFFGISAQIQTILIPVGIVFLVMYLYIEYTIICGIQDMEQSLGADLEVKMLFSVWKIVAFCCILANIAWIISSAVAFVFIIISIIANIMFLVSLHNSKKLYEQNRYIP